ncbi:MAG: hypothetical protein JW818_09115 [Pirellulales bacterium]|nr:hypothetical protein [Pirellulales bacterium]
MSPGGAMVKIPCPYCRVAVRPLEDGTCPRCDRLVVMESEDEGPENPFQTPLGRLRDAPWRRDRDGRTPLFL